jgi:hypothetical protein
MAVLLQREELLRDLLEVLVGHLVNVAHRDSLLDRAKRRRSQSRIVEERGNW